MLLKSTFNVGHLPLLALAAAILAALGLALSKPAAEAPNVRTSDPQQLVAILQYLESDYPAAVASGDAAELAEQRSLSAEALSTAARLSDVDRVASRVASIDERIARADDPRGVSADCASLVDDVIAATGLSRAPSSPPDLVEGEHLFKTSCAQCHGATGHGDGLAATSLKPRP